MEKTKDKNGTAGEQAVVVRRPIDLQINNVESLIQIGELFERSGMFGCDTQGQGLVIAMTCMQTGMSALEFNQTYHIVKGKPSMKADAMLAKFLERGGRHKVIERSPNRAAVLLSAHGNEYESSLTWEEAQKQSYVYQKDGKTLKDNWETERKRTQMMWARVISDGVRVLDPSVSLGIYTPEEVQDFEDARTVKMAVPTPMAATTQSDKAPTSAPHAEPATQSVEAELVKDDFSVVPVGKMKDKKWSELSDAQLLAASTWTHPAVTQAHRDAAKKEIETRKAKQPVK